jgi:hypothetical protein
LHTYCNSSSPVYRSLARGYQPTKAKPVVLILFKKSLQTICKSALWRAKNGFFMDPLSSFRVANNSLMIILEENCFCDVGWGVGWPPKGRIMSFSGRFISNKSRGNLSKNFKPMACRAGGAGVNSSPKSWEKSALTPFSSPFKYKFCPLFCHLCQQFFGRKKITRSLNFKVFF